MPNAQQIPWFPTLQSHMEGLAWNEQSGICDALEYHWQQRLGRDNLPQDPALRPAAQLLHGLQKQGPLQAFQKTTLVVALHEKET